jgi:hypothetical protein
MSAPAHLLRSWRKQRPSNKGDLEVVVKGEVEISYYTQVGLLLVNFVP